MKKMFVIFFVLFLCSCGGGDDSEGEPGFEITGFVYLDNQPISDIAVECGYTEETGVAHDWKNSTIRTDNTGKYHYAMQKMEGIYRYHVKAQHPISGVWSDYYQSTVTWGKRVTKDFYFTTEE